MAAKKEKVPAELPSLSKAEWEIMKILWDKGPMAARDIFAAVPTKHEWAYKTVKTLLSRLVSKGAVEYDQIGNSYLYRPACPRDKMTEVEVRSFFNRVLDGSVSTMLSYFVKNRELSTDQVDEIRKVIEKAKPTDPK